jgi:predicted transposase YdaD
MISAEMKGREEGEEIGVRKVAKSLLTRGMSFKEVAEITGMKRERVDELWRKIQVASESGPDQTPSAVHS